MERKDHPIRPKRKKANIQGTVYSPSLNEIVDFTDPGDETQRRYRYQHAYGVILLVAAMRKEKPYKAIWCEQHEDLLGERLDGLYDAYQIKTQLPEKGRWNLTKEQLKDSIKRFVVLDQNYPGAIHNFFFVSNVGYEDSKARNRSGYSPIQFLQAIGKADALADLPPSFHQTFEVLRTHCECSVESLLAVLKKIKLVVGPGLDSFEAEIAQDHLQRLPICSSWPAASLALLRNELLAQVYRASSLSIDDPNRHLHSFYGGEHLNPRLKAKRIVVQDIGRFIRENSQHFLKKTRVTSGLNLRLKETLLLYLKSSFSEDQFARLDQAGETDSDRSTLLRQVFVDLELKPHGNLPSRHYKQGQLPLFDLSDVFFTAEQEKVLSAMNTLLKEIWLKIVLIGGPGQGKSTLGQYLAQVHRAVYLKCEEKLYSDTSKRSTKRKHFKPKTLRIPFRIVLKYFAQWIADGPEVVSVEAYLAGQMGKITSRSNEISGSNVQEIMKHHPSLIIFDGLDEVMEPELRAHMLKCIESFLERAEALEADLQVLATSRPTGYSDQFDPHDYLHLELQPMSKEKIEEYAANWIQTKIAVEEESRRVRETLQECLREQHTRLLLTTPLQATIILLIIKDGGRPPAQREALFQQYWDTILRREKAKFKGILRTDDITLFNLHAYLGYVLHRKSASGNTRALFSEQEFSGLLLRFLQKDDTFSSETTLKQHALDMVEDARNRLVLLVEPEPGFFGFELRSLQEFFAGAYLVQTARDTSQRFERFRAIARSEHWRNVALFFAGRIVRSYSGEAEKILIDGCKPIDRQGVDRYLQRGAWLALDIAADGIFAQNRNLQYSILEYSLTIIDEDMIWRDSGRFLSALERLPPEDRRDMLVKLLRHKLNTLPFTFHPGLLGIYGKFIDLQPDYIQRLEALLSTGDTTYIQQAIDLGFWHEVDPHWLARQIEKNWDSWVTDYRPYGIQQGKDQIQHLYKVLSALQLSETQADQFLDTALLFHLRYPGMQYELLENPQTFSEQIICCIQCNVIWGNSIYLSSTPILFEHFKIEVSVFKPTNDYNMRVDHSRLPELLKTLSQLMERKYLIPQLRLLLWGLYWRFHELSTNQVEAFLEESKTWSKKDILLKFHQMLQLSLIKPLLGTALKYQLSNDRDAVQRLQPYITESQEEGISHQVTLALQKLASNPSSEAQTEGFLSLYSEMADKLPEITSIAEKIGIDADALLQAFVYKDPYFEFPYRGHEQLYSDAFLLQIFLMMEEIIDQSEKVVRIIEFLVTRRWSREKVVQIKGQRTFKMLLDRLPTQPDILPGAILLFLKLLGIDPSVLLLTRHLFPVLVPVVRTVGEYALLRSLLEDFLPETFRSLAEFIRAEDPHIQKGALTLWSMLIEAIEYPSLSLSREKVLEEKLKAVRFDWRIGFDLLQSSDSKKRQIGCRLLAFSDFLVAEKRYRDILLQMLIRAKDTDEIAAWAFFLQYFFMDDERFTWQEVLETILEYPLSYPPRIVRAAKVCYASLVGKAESGLIGDERDLGLPEVNL